MTGKNDDRFARLFFGQNVQTGTILMMGDAGSFILIVGGLFAWLR